MNWKFSPLAIFCGLLLAAPVAVAADEPAMKPLFDGTSLNGWEQHGGKAKYSVENGEIVGTSVPNTGNSFLCTDRNYDNFILEVEFKVDPLLNSGIQIRSNVYDVPHNYHVKDENGESKEITVPAGRVHGYQVEIDPSDRAWSAGIYDEGRRGWLESLEGDDHAEARAAFRQNQWNNYRIEAIGPHIKTWINGVPAADLHDDLTSTGFIALQVHGIGGDENKVGKQIRWRNIRIAEVAAPAQNEQDAGVTYEGGNGPGAGKTIVLVAGDEEYRSEEALPQLAKILAVHHGFRCRVLFPIDPETGEINPDVLDNIPGLEALDDADLLILFTRFRALPEAQMRHIDDYLKSGRPVIGIRTATHAFNYPEGGDWARYGNGYHGSEKVWTDGFGRLVLGERWHTHHGNHRHESTIGVIPADVQQHPVLKGIQTGDIWGPTDVYGVRLPLPDDSKPLVLGQVTKREGAYDENDPLYGLRPTDREPVAGEKNDPMMPIVWTKSYQLPGGEKGQALTSTIGSSTDLLNEGVRRVLVNGVYYLLGMGDEIPDSGTNVELVGDYQPTAFEFRDSEYWENKGLKPSDFAMPQ